MADPFTIRIYVPDGDPEGVRIIDRMNWTGKGITFPRDAWAQAQQRSELQQPGVYILIGRDEDEDQDLPLLYIGQTDDLLFRLKQHDKEKDFWDRAVVFVSTNFGLNRAHITWLEWALIQRAKLIAQSRLLNGNSPSEPPLSEFEKADTEGFLNEIIQILPLIGITAFDSPRVVEPRKIALVIDQPSSNGGEEFDTIIVPAKKDGFERVFLGENAWWAIRIAGGKRSKIKYIAAYQTKPISAVTHWAPVERIEPYGDAGKFRLIFSEPAKSFSKPITLKGVKPGAMQAPRYARMDLLLSANSLGEVLS